MMKGALSGLRVLDISRVLAGPFCTQILGDLGAEIIKIEQPGKGDDTRHWGPPFLKDKDGNDTSESAYYLSANRNKRSLAIDMAAPEGQKLIRDLAGQSDILIENFKTGGLAKYGLAYHDLKDDYPHLIYCSITGFGQTGPLAKEPGYDFLAQAMSGLMAITGEPDGKPIKVGVALSDIITGLYASIGILAAVQSRHDTGKGQYVDVALLDCTLASMTNIAQFYLTSGDLAARRGNAHATIVPYQAFETADGYIIVAVGNDRQFQRLAEALGQGWAGDSRFQINENRVKHRDDLVPIIAGLLKQKSSAHWLALFEKYDVPAGPVNTMDQVFDMDQIKARDMKISMKHSSAPDEIDLVGSPLKLSETPVHYHSPPPVLGQHSDDILCGLLDMTDQDVQKLKEKGIVG